MNKADKELEVMKWMQKQGYDRRATQEIAPIIVKYLEQHGATPAVMRPLPGNRNACPDCGMMWNSGPKHHHWCKRHPGNAA